MAIRPNFDEELRGLVGGFRRELLAQQYRGCHIRRKRARFPTMDCRNGPGAIRGVARPEPKKKEKKEEKRGERVLDTTRACKILKAASQTTDPATVRSSPSRRRSTARPAHDPKTHDAS